MNRYNIIFLLHDNKTKQDIFLYGVSLPTKSKIIDFDFENKDFFDKNENILKDKTLIMFKNISENYEISNNLNIKNIFKDEKINYNKLKTIDFTYKQEVIQTYNDYENETPESILKLPIETDIYYTKDFFEYYGNDLKNSFSEIVKILNYLKERTGLSFIDNISENIYSKRLGCFEYIKKIPEFIEERNKIFEVKSKCSGQNNRIEKFYIKKLIKYNKTLSVILMVYNDLEDIIFCQKKK